MKYLLVLLAIALAPPILNAAEQVDSPEQELSTKVKKKKKRLKKRMRKKMKSLPWFPSWQVPEFDWGFDPILGFKARKTETGGIKTTTVATEAGAHLQLKNISLNSGPTRFQVSPHGGLTYGYLAQDSKSDDLNLDQGSRSERSWYGLKLSGYHKAYRHEIGVHRGKINYAEDFASIQNLSLRNDMGVMVLPHLSAHLTTNYQTVFQDSLSKPTLKEMDHWLHGKVAFDFLSLMLDAGPGMTTLDSYAEVNGENQHQFKSDTQYLLSTLSGRFFWRFGFWGSVRYTFNADSDLTGAESVLVQLPNQNLNDPSTIQTLPEDSLDSFLFVGIQNLFAGFGFGYKYSVLVLNYGEKDGTDRQVFRDNGYTITYELSL